MTESTAPLDEFKDALGRYEAVLYDSWGSVPIGWGFRIRTHLGPERFERLAAFGAVMCAEMGAWVLVTKLLTAEEAKEKYGEPVVLRGPKGGYRGIAYGTTVFYSKYMKPAPEVVAALPSRPL